eukprot:2538736-Pyramimonas_sp.AAC.1
MSPRSHAGACGLANLSIEDPSSRAERRTSVIELPPLHGPFFLGHRRSSSLFFFPVGSSSISSSS